MTVLIRDGVITPDGFVSVTGTDHWPAHGPIIVSLEQWKANAGALIARQEPLGIRLRSDQDPGAIAGDLEHFELVALEFPVFKDGRAYSHARLLRERWGYTGELRAVGDVLLEQLHFMQRVGFNAFEIAGADPLRDWEIASKEFSVWYQATGDGRTPARDLRHR